MTLFFIALGCASVELAQTWSELPASTYCASKDVDDREQCRIEECQGVTQESIAPAKADVPALTMLCELSESSNTESAQACGLQACYYLPQLELSEGMRILQSSLPVAAAQKQARAAILRGIFEQENLLALVLDSAKANVSKNSTWYGLAVAELDCTANGISERLGLQCPSVSEANVLRILDLAESAKDSPTEYHTLLNMAAAADFSVAAPALTAVLKADSSMSVQRAALGAIQVALLRGERLPRDLVNEWVSLCDSAPLERQSVCAQLMQ